MAIRLGDIAPDFTADTTEGEISFHDWKKGSWAVLFSHPKDFTPVCTTELGRTAALNSEFTARNVKTIAVSVDPLDSHQGWAGDIGDNRTLSKVGSFFRRRWVSHHRPTPRHAFMRICVLLCDFASQDLRLKI